MFYVCSSWIGLKLVRFVGGGGNCNGGYGTGWVDMVLGGFKMTNNHLTWIF